MVGDADPNAAVDDLHPLVLGGVTQVIGDHANLLRKKCHQDGGGTGAHPVDAEAAGRAY
jgi:hypothetical protein